MQKFLSQVLNRDAWQQVPGKGGIFSSVGVAAGALVATVNAAFAQAVDTSLPKLADLTAVLHHGLRGATNLVRNIERSFDVGLSSLTLWILHLEKIIDGLPLAPLVFHSLLQENSAQCLARTTAT